MFSYTLKFPAFSYTSENNRHIKEIQHPILLRFEYNTSYAWEYFASNFLSAVFLPSDIDL